MKLALCLLAMILLTPVEEISAATVASTTLFQPSSTTTKSTLIETAPNETAAVTTTSSASTQTRTTADSDYQPDYWLLLNDILYYWEWFFSIIIWVGLTGCFIILGIRKKIYFCFCLPRCSRNQENETE